MDKKKETGSLVVEATIVFPVMFLVIFLMLFAGNAYMQKCRIEAIFNELALDGAAYCADPLLFDTEQVALDDTGKLSMTTVKEFDANPYGFLSLDVNADDCEFGKYLVEQIENRISNMSTGLFSGMEPKVIGKEIYYNESFFCPSFVMNIVCEVVIPVRLLGQEDFTVFKISNHIELPAADTMDLVRTIDMIEDYILKYGVDDKIDKLIGEVKKLLPGSK